MLRKHSLLVISVFLSLYSRLPLLAHTDFAVDDWNRESHPMKKDPYGVFELVIPAEDGQPAIAHNSKIKVGLLRSASLSTANSSRSR